MARPPAGGIAPRRVKVLWGPLVRSHRPAPLSAWTAYISHDYFSRKPVALTVAQTVAAVIDKVVNFIQTMPGYRRYE
jgi:hypothetical protein